MSKRAAGPDGLSCEILRGMRYCWEPPRQLFYCILASGSVPRALLRLFVAPVDKPKHHPELCSSKRPIPLHVEEADLVEEALEAVLPPVLAKVLEIVICHRIIEIVGSGLDDREFAL